MQQNLQALLEMTRADMVIFVRKKTFLLAQPF